MGKTVCIAVYEKSADSKSGHVVCYEKSEKGERVVSRDIKKCRYCIQLTDAIDKMMEHKDWK